MTERSTGFDCVVDASVGIKLFLVEPLSDRADALFAHLAGDPPGRFYVPDLFFVECTNVLWKYTWRFGYSLEAARQDVVDLTRLPLQVVSTASLVEAALEVAVKHGSTAYDSTYVILARELSLPLITADEELVRRFQGSGPDVRFLGDVDSDSSG